jgi:hypothetical protein
MASVEYVGWLSTTPIVATVASESMPVAHIKAMKQNGDNSMRAELIPGASKVDEDKAVAPAELGRDPLATTSCRINPT